MLLSWVSNPAKEHYEKDADSLNPDSNHASGAVRNNRTGRWWRDSADLLAAVKQLHQLRTNPVQGLVLNWPPEHSQFHHVRCRAMYGDMTAVLP